MKKLLKHPWLVIGIIVAITIFFGIQLTGLKVENTARQFMPQNSDSYTRLMKTEDEFGSMIAVGISLETQDETILTPEYITIIDSITKRIENIENIDSVDSLTNIDFIQSEDGVLVAGNLVGDDFSGTKEEISEIKAKLHDWDEMYNRVIISDDEKSTQMMITLDPNFSSSSQTEILHELKTIINEETKGTDLKVVYFGDPVLSDSAYEFMFSDLVRLIPLVIIVVLLSLFFSFRTIEGTFLPLITVVFSTVWACGLMALFNINFTIVSSVIPVALIACGSAYGIHILNHYFIYVDEIEGEITKEKYQNAIFTSLKDVWIAVLLAGITTFVGFISLVTSPLEPLHSFSIFTALGIVFSLLLSVFLIPAVLLLKPVSKVKRSEERKGKLSEKVKEKMAKQLERNGGKTSTELTNNTLYNIYHFFAGTKPRLLFFGIIILVLSVIGIRNLNVDTAMVNYFPSDSEFRQGIAYADEKFAGTNSLYFIISGQEKGDLTKPEILKSVDNLQIYLREKYPEIGKTVSFTTFIKKMNQVMHIPGTDALVSAENVSFESSGETLSSFASFADDSAEDTSGFSSFADDSFSSFADDVAQTETGNAGVSESVSSEPFVDPNIAFEEALSSSITVKEGLALLQNAYIEAGGKKASFESIVDQLEKSLNYNGSAYYEVPYDPSKYPATKREELSDLVSQYLLLFSGSLDRFSDDALAPQTIRMQVQLRNHNTNETAIIINDAKDYAAKHFPKGYTLEATGNGELEVTMTQMVLQSQFMSLFSSLLLVFIIISISFKSLLAGLFGAIPLALTICLNYMVMGFTGISLDFVTSLIAPVAVGVGIDYTIHFLETYRAEREINTSLEDVTKITLRKSGHGIITNAIAVGLGFLVLCFSKFVVLRYIGILVFIVMFISSALSMTIIPGVLNAFDPKFMHKGKK